MHKKYRYIIQLIGSDKYNISCKKHPTSGSDLELTEADLKHIHNLGMDTHIDPRYALKLEKILQSC